MVDTDDTRRTTNDGRGTTPRVWHKLPTGELKNMTELEDDRMNKLLNELIFGGYVQSEEAVRLMANIL